MLWFNFIIGLNFNFPLFWGMVMYDEFEIKENKIIVYFMLLDSQLLAGSPQQHDANYCWPVTVPPHMRARPPHRGLRALFFTNSVWVL